MGSREELQPLGRNLSDKQNRRMLSWGVVAVAFPMAIMIPLLVVPEMSGILGRALLGAYTLILGVGYVDLVVRGSRR